jgi:type IV pilus assembly protein PilE
VKKNGFSLIELVVAMGIVGILAAIAIPAYTSYTKTANRTDATRTLTSYAQALERCYSQAFTYVGCSAIPATLPAASAQGYYSVTFPVLTASSFTITATPLKAPQTSDSTCTSFSVDNTGAQSTTPAANSPTCWGST